MDRGGNKFESILSEEICVNYLGRNLCQFSWNKFVAISSGEICVNIFGKK